MRPELLVYAALNKQKKKRNLLRLRERILYRGLEFSFFEKRIYFQQQRLLLLLLFCPFLFLLSPMPLLILLALRRG
jgi:hypothetical protein